MNIGPLEDRVAIRELIDRFAAGVMRKNAAIWGDAWTEDGVWGLPTLPEPRKGKANLIALFEEKMAPTKFISMICSPVDLVIDGDRAHGKCYSQEVIYPHAGGRKFAVGCFADDYLKRDGRWYFTSRIFELIGIDM